MQFFEEKKVIMMAIKYSYNPHGPLIINNDVCAYIFFVTLHNMKYYSDRPLL